MLAAEYDMSGTLRRRYLPGDGADEPLIWYEGAGLDRRYLAADERGSVVEVSDNAGATRAIDTYDDWGMPAQGNAGRFGYTGQTWLPSVQAWYYKARLYNPVLGRFHQTDPMASDSNLYRYVGNDPVNATDPSGLVEFLKVPEPPVITVTAQIAATLIPTTSLPLSVSLSSGQMGPPAPQVDLPDVINVFGQRPKPPAAPPPITFLPVSFNFNTPSLATQGQNTNTHTCPKGSRVTASIGGSATGAFLYGAFSVGAEVGVSLPTNFFSTGSLRGLQIYGSVSFQGLAGFGFFAGAGATPSVGYSNGPIQSGASDSHVVGGGAALGAGGEASVATNGSGGSVSGGPEAGVGAYAGYGGKVSGTAATPQIGCTP